jgi:hypothetical protein
LVHLARLDLGVHLSCFQETLPPVQFIRNVCLSFIGHLRILLSEVLSSIVTCSSVHITSLWQFMQRNMEFGFHQGSSEFLLALLRGLTLWKTHNDC